MTYDQIRDSLLARIPQEQKDAVYAQDRCEIDNEYIGFVEVYAPLVDIIPKHHTIIDLGCGYAPQAFLFDKHAQYIGVDLGGIRFYTGNTIHFSMTIQDFITVFGAKYARPDVFAICSYVPDRKACAMARAAFTNIMAFYPA